MKKRKIAAIAMVIMTIVSTSSMGVFASADTISSDSNIDTQTEQSDEKPEKVEISDEQLTAINELRTESINEAVANMVEKGTLTQEEADAVLAGAKVKAKDSQRRSQGNFKNLTDEQREAIKTEIQSLYEAALADLVTDGTITQDQADQLIVGKGMYKKLDLTEIQRTGVKDAITNSMQQASDNLVAKGTLTQEEADAVLTKPDKNNLTEERSEINKEQLKENGYLKNFSDEQIQSLKEEIDTIYKNALAELVSDGTISQEIADHVQDMPFGMRHGKGNGIGQKMKNSNAPIDTEESI